MNKVKKSLWLMAICTVACFSSCVSSKKYKNLDASYRELQKSDRSCQDQLKEAVATNKALESQLEDLKANNKKVLNTLQDMSVITGKQAESIQKSLENMSKKDAYIMDLQSALTRKDSLNMALVMNLKRSLADVNDQDIEIKVDKGVVFIDISDKMLFNSGRFTVTEKAHGVLSKVAQVLNDQPEMEIMVEGHTDSIPIKTECLDDNWDLSVKRATSVVRILQTKYKIDPARMTAAGHSKYRPLSSNEKPEGRSINRRTRIIIMPQLDQFFKLMEPMK